MGTETAGRLLGITPDGGSIPTQTSRTPDGSTVQPVADPFGLVDALDGGTCFHAPPDLITADNIPHSLTQEWADVTGDVLTMAREAGQDPQQRERGLKWPGFLPQFLLHIPPKMQNMHSLRCILGKRLRQWKDRKMDVLVREWEMACRHSRRRTSREASPQYAHSRLSTILKAIERGGIRNVRILSLPL